MCGRFKLSKPVRVVADLFSLPDVPEELRPRYNVSPTQAIPVARLADGARELATVRWAYQRYGATSGQSSGSIWATMPWVRSTSIR